MITYSFASSNDSAACNKLLSEVEVPGQLELLFQREPDFFKSLNCQYKYHRTVKASFDGKLIGLVTYSSHQVFINGNPCEVGHVSNLRILPQWRNKKVVRNGAPFLNTEVLREKNLDICYITTPVGNESAKKLNLSHKPYLPDFHDFGKIITHIIQIKRYSNDSGLELRWGIKSEMDEIIGFINKESSNLDFAPLCDKNRVNPSRFYIAKKDGDLVGAVYLWNQADFRQIIVKRYGLWMKVFNSINNLCSAVGICKKSPKIGENIPLVYTGFLSIKNADCRVFGSLLSKISNDLWKTDCAYLITGLHEQDPLNEVFKSFSGICYKSNLLIASKNSAILNEINKSRIRIDLSFI